MTAFALWLAGGFATGLAYFAGLRLSAEFFAASGGGVASLLLTLARLAGIAAFLGLAASVGALPLLLGFAGFLAARTLALHLARRAA
jgi:N-ATPase, AtpR subunit